MFWRKFKKTKDLPAIKKDPSTNADSVVALNDLQEALFLNKRLLTHLKETGALDQNRIKDLEQLHKENEDLKNQLALIEKLLLKGKVNKKDDGQNLKQP